LILVSIIGGSGLLYVSNIVTRIATPQAMQLLRTTGVSPVLERDHEHPSQVAPVLLGRVQIPTRARQWR
jgi:hypothetical protein